jgi:hypothetical protein
VRRAIPGQSTVGVALRTKKRLQDLSSSAFDLSAGNWSYVGDIPADAGECFHDGDDHNDQKCQMNERCDDRPKKYQNAADAWNRPEDRMHHR